MSGGLVDQILLDRKCVLALDQKFFSLDQMLGQLSLNQKSQIIIQSSAKKELATFSTRLKV